MVTNSIFDCKLSSRLPICYLKRCFNAYRSALLDSRDSSRLPPIRCKNSHRKCFMTSLYGSYMARLGIALTTLDRSRITNMIRCLLRYRVRQQTSWRNTFSFVFRLQCIIFCILRYKEISSASAGKTSYLHREQLWHKNDAQSNQITGNGVKFADKYPFSMASTTLFVSRRQ